MTIDFDCNSPCALTTTAIPAAINVKPRVRGSVTHHQTSEHISCNMVTLCKLAQHLLEGILREACQINSLNPILITAARGA